MIILPDYRVRQRDFLLKISRAITAQLDLDQLLRMVLEASVSMLGGVVGLIALRNPMNDLKVQAILGIEPEQLKHFDPILQMTDTDQISIDPDELKLRTRLIARKLDMNLRQVVSLPMRISNETLGVIYVFRAYPGAPTSDELMILHSFADQAAIAVHNAGLYQATIAEKQRLSAILESSGDGVMILDADGRILRFNKSLARMTGWQFAYALDRYHEDVIQWKEPTPEPTLEMMIQSGWPAERPFDDEEPSIYSDFDNGVFYVEGDIERLDGTVLSVGITYSPLLFDDGELRNIVCDVRDITHFRDAERMKSTFISVISHELKTPVALIKGYADTLSRDDANWDKNTVRRGLNVIQDEADRLTELIENLLIATKLQVEGVLNLELQEFNLLDLVTKLLNQFDSQTPHHELLTDISTDLPVVPADPRHIRSVLENLISNAVKYSPQGGEVLVRARYDDEKVEVAVQDQGVGLSVEEQEQVFNRFYRSKSADIQSVPGTGLGLYLTREIVHAHGGKIWVSSKGKDKGTTFWFTLPRYDE